MSSITSVGTTTTTTTSSTTATMSTSTSGDSSAIPASISADLSFEAGVVATFSDPSATDATADLYTNLASLSATSTTSSGVDLNQQWANAVSANPSLAPLAEQMSSTEALLNAVL